MTDDARPPWTSRIMLTVDQRQMRVWNSLTVLNTLRSHGTLSRSNLQELTGLSRTTVGSIVNDLIGAGLAQESAVIYTPKQAGRPAATVRFQAQIGHIIAIDLDRSHLAILLADLDGHVRRRETFEFSVQEGPLAGLKFVAMQVQTFLAQEGITLRPEQVVGIGVGLPGPLDQARHQLVRGAPNMPGWSGIDLDEELARALEIWDEQQRISRVPIYLENDANLGALGLYHYGSDGQGKGTSELMYVKLGIGIGAGIIHGGSLYLGTSGSAGEIGHIRVMLDQAAPVCYCKKRGCLEAVAGAEALIAGALSRNHNESVLGHQIGSADAADSTAHSVSATQRTMRTMRTIAAGAREHDPVYTQIFAEAGSYIGLALAAAVYLINPAIIVLDGDLAQGAQELIAQPIQEVIQREVLPAIAERCRVTVASPESDAVGWGAIATVVEQMLGKFVEARLEDWEKRKEEQKTPEYSAESNLLPILNKAQQAAVLNPQEATS